jgi:hypothetical protein
MSSSKIGIYIDSVIVEADKLRKLLAKGKTATVRNADEVGTIKAVAYSWFKRHRQEAVGAHPDVVSQLDALYKKILDGSDRQTSRSIYDSTLKEIRKNLLLCRAEQLVQQNVTTPDTVPDFSSVTADPKMQAILSQRWMECGRCLKSEASLAATVMMGGLLEALLLSKINLASDKPAVFNVPSAPKDSKSGKVKPLKEWGLKDYISVSHEMGWISVSAKDVGAVLRDYLNYIHPFKQLSHEIELKPHDAQLFWEITKSITRQLV